jgi:hypothetical protein
MPLNVFSPCSFRWTPLSSKWLRNREQAPERGGESADLQFLEMMSVTEEALIDEEIRTHQMLFSSQEPSLQLPTDRRPLSSVSLPKDGEDELGCRDHTSIVIDAVELGTFDDPRVPSEDDMDIFDSALSVLLAATAQAVCQAQALDVLEYLQVRCDAMRCSAELAASGFVLSNRAIH